jgi:hypothetical protein
MSFANCLDVKNDVINLEEINFMNQRLQKQNSKVNSTNNSIADYSQFKKQKGKGFNYDISSAELKEAIGKATITLAQLAYNPNLIINNSDSVLSTSKTSTSANSTKKRNRLERRFEAEVINELSILDGFSFDKYADEKKCLIPHLLTKNLNNKLTTWQVRVHLIELKHILGNNENIYCAIQIGSQTFYSSVKSVDKLKFNEVIYRV